MRKLLVLFCCALFAPPLLSQPIRIGDVNSYRDFPAHLEPYRKGWMLAQEQINAAGGVNGRRIAVIARDDGGGAHTAVRTAKRLVGGDKVHALMGGFAANISAAVAQYAGEQKILYVGTGPFTDGLAGNRYTFQLRPSAATQIAMVMPEVLRLRKQFWGIIYPHTAHGYAAVQTFKALLKKAQPNVVFVMEQAVPLGKADGAALVLQTFSDHPEAIFSSLSGVDLRDFVLEGNAAKLFRHVQVVNLQAGQPEDLALLKEAAPEGWWVTGYPWKDINYYPHKRFVAAYLKRWGEAPGAGSLVGYTAVVSIAQAARRANSTQTERLVDGLEGLETLGPLGVIEWRKTDHQSTFGTFVGQLGKHGQDTAMVRWRYEPGSVPGLEY